jgi:hypothetical protein
MNFMEVSIQFTMPKIKDVLRLRAKQSEVNLLLIFEPSWHYNVVKIALLGGAFIDGRVV